MHQTCRLWFLLTVVASAAFAGGRDSARGVKLLPAVAIQ